MHFFNPLLLCVVASLAGVVKAAPLGKRIEPDALAKEIMGEADFSAESASGGPSVSEAAYGISASASSVPSAATALPTVSAAAPVAAPAVTVVTEVVTEGGGAASATAPTSSSSTSSPSPAPSNMVPSKESVSGMNPFTNPYWEAWNAEWNRQKEAAAAATAAEDGKKDLSAEEQIAEDRRKQEEEIKKKIAIEKEKHDYEMSQYDPYENLMPGCPPKAAGGAEMIYWIYCLWGHETYDAGEHWY